MSRARIYRASMETPPPKPKARIYRAAMAGSALLRPKARIYRAAMQGTRAVVVASIAARTVDPGVLVSITAALVGGEAADSWTWRPVSGPAVGLAAPGATCTFTSPSAVDAQRAPMATTVVLGVRATIGNVQSPEVLVTVNVLPQLVWTHDGSAYAASRIVTA